MMVCIDCDWQSIWYHNNEFLKQKELSQEKQMEFEFYILDSVNKDIYFAVKNIFELQYF